MRTLATLLAGSAMGLLLAAGTAQAGACSGEIMALQKQMEETPTKTSNAAPSGQTGVSPLPSPGTVPENAGQTLGAPPSDAAGGSQTAHAMPNGSGETGTAGTVEQPDASGGTLVQNDATPQPAPTEPMDSDASSASQLNTAAGTDTTDTGATGTDAAAQALTRARALDQAGDEAGCMTAVDEAKSHLAE